jgi:hypothetical protein
MFGLFEKSARVCPKAMRLSEDLGLRNLRV